MTRTRKTAFRYLKLNPISIACMLLLYILTSGCTNDERILRGKIEGFLNMDTEHSTWDRGNDDVYLSDGVISFDEDSVFLPVIRHYSDSCYRVDINASDPRFIEDEKIQKKIQSSVGAYKRNRLHSRGCWYIVSTEPDSIFINAPHHPLHGKYSVTFFSNKQEIHQQKAGTIEYWVRLENDSTYILGTKGGIVVDNRPYLHWDTK